MKRQAKIIATLGPATESPEMLQAALQAGMDVARLNFSHGSHASHRQLITRLRDISRQLERPVGIMMDLQGPRLRTGPLRDDQPVELQPDAQVVLVGTDEPSRPGRIAIAYPGLTQDLAPGARVLLDDGRIELQVTEIRGHEALARVVNPGTLTARKGVHLPDTPISLPALTEKDRRDLAFGLGQGVDCVALSFVRRAEDIHQLRRLVAQVDPALAHLPLIAKLERRQAIERLDEILDAADGVMVARGDLGVEVSAERVPSLQKEIIQRANRLGKLVITATQMLETMVHNPRPTRAEASDVANAVFDGSDALMLSAETAIGQYPLEALRTMDRIIRDAEAHAKEWSLQWGEMLTVSGDDAMATSRAAHALAEDRNVHAIAVFTRTGRTARLMSKTRPDKPILAFTPETRTYNAMSLYWGVEPHLVPMSSSVEEMLAHVERALKESGRIHSGQQVVLVASLPVGAMGPANFTLLHTVR